MTKAHAKKSAIVAPTTLDAALDLIEEMRGVVTDLEGQVESIRDDHAAAVGSMEDEIEKAMARADEAEIFGEDVTMELARIIQKMKAGRTADAICDLDRVLQEIDCGGKYRIAAVAVMH